MRHRKLVTVLFLAFWVLLGPVGMAYSGCAQMDHCAALCGVACSASLPPSATSIEVPGFSVRSGLDGHLPLNGGKVPDAPPKFALPSL